MHKLTTICAACAIALSAGAAGATELGVGNELDERLIDIKGGVFFPPMLLAATGEAITIRNTEDTVHDASAIDGTWSTGPIQPGAQIVVVITPAMTKCFKSTYNEEYKGAFGDPSTGEAPLCFVLSGAGDGSLSDLN